VNVAHHGRGLNAHQRTALEADGVRCANVACNRTVAIQIDHRRPYADDPVTDLANQDPLCPDCHRRKTHHGWRLAPGTGRRRFIPPTDERSADPDHAPAWGPTSCDRPPADPANPADPDGPNDPVIASTAARARAQRAGAQAASLF
jgi:hypothetical protein